VAVGLAASAAWAVLRWPAHWTTTRKTKETRAKTTGGWSSAAVPSAEGCDLEVYDAPPATWPSGPALVKHALADEDAFFAAWTAAALRASRRKVRVAHRGADVVASGGNPADDMSVGAVLDAVLAEEDLVAFGDMDGATPPSFRARRLLFRRLRFPSSSKTVVSIGPRGGGLPTHAHGDAWLALAHGAKRWFVAGPDEPLEDDPLATSRDVYARGGYANASSCLQLPGDVVFVPRGFKHATLNVAAAVAVGQQASNFD